MKTIVIAPLSTPATLTVQAWERITHAKTLFLQTALHPSAKPVLDAGLAYTSMDDLYERAEDFDKLNLAVAGRLVSAGDCVYAVTGASARTQIPVILETAGAAGVQVETLPGVALAEAAFPECDLARICAASTLPAHLDPEEGLAIEELDSRLAAGDVKLRLSEYYPDDWAILFSRMDAAGHWRRRSIPLYELDRQNAYSAATAVYVPAAPFDARKRYGYQDLLAVMARLRARDGCPWDRKQTHESLKQPLLEECYELMDAIDGKDDAHIVEELGDVLMQVAFHETIGAEQARFTDRDVTTGLVGKLVYRHPHIFGTAHADTAEEVLANWDKLKKVEKDQKTQTEVLQSVPKNFPALIRSSKVQKKAADVGFDWPNAEEAFFKIGEETEELRAAMASDGNVPEEMGDLLFAAVNVARLLKLDPESLLQQATDKFIGRFSDLERLALEKGRLLSDMSLAEMDTLWEEVKTRRKQEKISQS